MINSEINNLSYIQYAGYILQSLKESLISWNFSKTISKEVESRLSQVSIHLPEMRTTALQKLSQS